MAAPKVPRVVSATTGDIGAGRYPRALVVASASWVLLGVVLLLSRIGSPDSTDAQETNAATGVTAVRAPDYESSWFASYLPVLGVLVVIAAVLLFLGYGWTRLVLALFGLLAVVALAASANWLAIPAAVLFVLGAVCSVLISTHRYLVRPRTGGEPADPQSTRVVS